MVDEQGVDPNKWDVEDVPDNDLLFYRVHVSAVRDGEPTPGAFRDRGDSMSTDWSKYSTPRESQLRARTPEDNGIVQLEVRAVCGIPQIVEHSPDYVSDNRAHTSVIGKKDTEVRFKLLGMYQWAIAI